MNRPLRILHLEDEPDYSAMVRGLFAKEGVPAEFVLVSNRASFEAVVGEQRFDAILADYWLPGYTGLEALKTAREKCPETPFLLVSGTIGEQAAVESLKAGATDYVLKGWPERLVPAICRAVQEAEERAQRKQMESERQRAEQALRQSEQQYRLIFDGNPTPMWVFDHNTLAFLEVNDAAIQHYGFSREEFLQMKLTDLRADQEGPAMIEYMHKLVGGSDSSRMAFAGLWRHRKKDGSLMDVEVKWSPVCFQGQAASLTMINDVTQRKRVEHRDAALSQLGQSLSSAVSPPEAARIIKTVAEDLFAWDVLTVALYSTEQDKLCSLLSVGTDKEGRRYEEPLGGLGEPPSGVVRRVLQEGAELVFCEPLAGGEPRPLSLALAPIRNRTKVIGLLSIQSFQPQVYTSQDLSTLEMLADHCGGALERIRAEQALRSSETLFQDVWENSADGMYLADENGTIVAVNGAFCRLVGMSREELEGKPFTVAFADSEGLEPMRQRFRQQFRERLTVAPRERRLSLRNGSAVVLEDCSSFVELRGQPPLMLGLFRNVTEQRRLEEQLRQSQKMEAIGQLAGGVAHDFNNILTVIHGHGSLLLESPNLSPHASRSAQQIVQAAERAAGLTRQLLAFGRRQLIQPRQLDLNEVVSNMTKMLARLLGEHIALQLYYSSQPALLLADAGMMEQVLLNLSVNARDAMPNGGVLSLRVSAGPLEHKALAQDVDDSTGRFVCLTVSDTGCGIAPENLRRIFDPFFTTKEVGKGTGLGLATVYGIVNQHKGWVEVSSELGKGSSFRVFLPGLVQRAEVARESGPPLPVRGGSETILVVEDEAAVRELVCELLESYGYKILRAESGAKALEVWERCKADVDLVLTDLIMPDRVNGRELAERLLAERPSLKVIFTSGYSADVVGKDFVLNRGLRYLQKPYPPQRLAQTIRDCLDATN